MAMLTVLKILIIVSVIAFTSSCGSRNSHKQDRGQSSMKQSAIERGAGDIQMQGQDDNSLQQNAGGSVQHPVRGDVYYEYEPVFAPEEVRKHMVGKWKFYIDSVKVRHIGHGDLRHAIKGSFNIVLGNVGKDSSCTVSIPDVSLDELYMEIVSPACEDVDDNGVGYTKTCFADFQIVPFIEQIESLTPYNYVSVQGTFVSFQKWKGAVSAQGVRYYGTAHRIR